jgi:hypothetical protein
MSVSGMGSWGVDGGNQPSSATQPPAQVPAAAAIAETPASTAAVTENAEDPELDKRRQRAARFGIEYVEPKPKKAPKEKKTVDVSVLHCIRFLLSCCRTPTS